MPDFSTISPHLDVRVSPRARRMALRLDTARRRVCLVIPKRASLRNAYAFALSHRDWIEQKVSELPTGIALTHGTVIPVLGRDVTIIVEHDDTARVTDITLTDTTLHVRTRLDDVEPRLLRYLKKLAGEEFLKIARDKAALIDRPLNNLALRDMKTRWGSCSTDGRMCLSWRLIFAPFEAYEYVIAHEAAHLVHPNHGPHFWDLCEKLSTDFTGGHAWMKTHGNTLMQYGRKF